MSYYYAPNNVRLSVSPSRRVVKGSSVTFSCSSDANPPVAQSGYSLFRDGQFVSKGQSHTIAIIQPNHSGRYYCQAWNNISRGGAKWINSDVVNLDVQYHPMNMTVSMDPANVMEGSSVNLTCSSVANPAADSYTWYKITDSSSSSSSPSSSSELLQVGSGQVLSIPSVEASHTGLYLCQARNRQGENNATEVLLTVGKDNVSLSVQVLSGIGVALFMTFFLLLLLLSFWMKQKTCAEKKTPFDSSFSGRGSTFSSSEDPSNSVYVNIHRFPSSPSPAPAAPDFTPSSHSNSNKELDANTSHEAEVTYSTVTIKPRNPGPPRHRKNSNAPQDSRSAAGENDNSVIYATINKSS
ncbi:carcinoembryonic antigen-related cell adhesion molecule 5-like [Scomber scombrus]|uniref:carcinoembryonic antigen-related cell adhesion molecule 5-like n=1 Tax=Scomber scombrus TaxID=13677 RepID=UPI002DDAA6D3|nr:carcinoembryonic antigen-related cell adhesion molecule 5-like [Scomber scombrus]